MGHRENLITAARECLLKTGYARTTVRDLVAASGANQASINYHFGSKEQLLTQTLLDLNREWGELLFTALADPAGENPDAETKWERIIASMRENRDLWFVNFESISYLQDEEIRKINSHGQQQARTALAASFGGLGEDAPREEVQAVGSHYYSLLVGTALQWLTDPDHAPSAADVARADRRTR